MAYRAVVKQYGLKVGYFGVRNVQSLDGSTMSYKSKKIVVDALEDFCLSSYIDPDKYLKNTLTPVPHDLFKYYLDEFANGTVTCNHSFYLKMYHTLLVHGEIVPDEVDVLLLDECGDVTELTLDIFRRLPAIKKVAVGDPFQNIYGFNKTVNAFTELTEGIEVDLTTSFRVSNKIAPRIESFMRKYLDKSVEFKGHTYPKDFTPGTKAYISRNNSGLLDEMFRLYEEGTPFNTTRSIDDILELPLMLGNLGNGAPITDYKYKHIEKLRLKWNASSKLQQTYRTVTSYVSKILNDDEEIQRALKTVYKHGPKDLNKLAMYVRNLNKTKTNLTLTTAHSSKGLEWGEVEIAPDLNEAVTKALTKIMEAKINHKPQETKVWKEELRLYYVAISRAMVTLTNAKYAKVL